MNYSTLRCCVIGALLVGLLLPSSMGWAKETAEVESNSEFVESGESDAHDDHGSGDQPFLLRVDPGAAIWNLVIFLLVFGVLSKFAWPPILDGLRAREDKIRGDLENAERVRGEAEAVREDYQNKLDDAQTQVQSMLTEARNDAEQTKAKILEEAKAEADRYRDRAVAEIETAKASAVSDMANLSSGIALQLAQQVVGRELNQNDHADLIQKSLENLPSTN